MGAEEYLNAIKSIRLDLLELLGSGYVIEHCISAFSESTRKRAYEAYVTDALKNMNKSIAERFGGSYMTARFADIFEKKTQEHEMSGDEIAEDIIRRAGLRPKGGEENDSIRTDGEAWTGFQ